jgi:ribosomal protein S12 methylthiotransferase
VLGVGSIHEICAAVEAIEKKKKKCRYTSFLPNDEVKLGGDRVLISPDYSAYIKIAEGCDNRCAYCAIPAIRGKFRSRTIEDIVAEARQLEALGVRELNVVAQDITRYGLDIYGEYSLHKLLRAITDATEIPWIRLLYCYPDKVTDELIAEIRDNDRIVKYIDMPLQHISDPILKRMNRRGDSTLIKGVIEKLRREIPEIVIRTTFIVGFPGETEEDFEKLCEFVKEQQFERLGCFAYSREEGTPAADLDGQLDEEVKSRRAEVIMDEQYLSAERYNQSMIGKEIEVVIEGFDKYAECFFGRTAADAPDIDPKVFITSTRGHSTGEFVKVVVDDYMEYDLIATVI